MPKISVILPVYNAEKYLREAIDSILSQTFTDFELLLINDGSTDRSETIILSYRDERIVYVKNQQNNGLIYTLNKGIELAKGEYLARMDADDVAKPVRLEKQLHYLTTSAATLVATRVALIDEHGNALPDWKDDAKNISPSQIKSYLLKNNCLAHPTILGETSIFRQYKYRYNQKYSEDYDLWLRLVGDGILIHKLDEVLLHYRVLSQSETRSKKFNVFLRLAKVKAKFVKHQIAKGKLTGYTLAALLHAGLDLVKAAGKEVKQFFKR